MSFLPLCAINSYPIRGIIMTYVFLTMYGIYIYISMNVEYIYIYSVLLT